MVDSTRWKSEGRVSLEVVAALLRFIGVEHHSDIVTNSRKACRCEIAVGLWRRVRRELESVLLRCSVDSSHAGLVEHFKTRSVVVLTSEIGVIWQRTDRKRADIVSQAEVIAVIRAIC